MAWSCLLQVIPNLVKEHGLMALNTFIRKCWNVQAMSCCMKTFWCFLLYVCRRNRTGCLVSSNFPPWNLVFNHCTFARLQVHRVVVFLLWCSLRRSLENNHQSVSAEGEIKRKIKLEIMCWFPNVQHFLSSSKALVPSCCGAKTWDLSWRVSWGRAAAVAGNPSDRPESLLRKAQGS